MALSETFDSTDLELLARLQEDSSLTVAELAGAIDMSTNAAWRRIKALDDRGIIARRVAVLNFERVGSGLTAFMSIKADQYSQQWHNDFVRVADGIPEITEIYRMSGTVDFLLKIRCADIQEYDRICHALISRVPVRDMSTSFSIDEIKFTTNVPLRGR